MEGGKCYIIRWLDSVTWFRRGTYILGGKADLDIKRLVNAGSSINGSLNADGAIKEAKLAVHSGVVWNGTAAVEFFLLLLSM